MNTLVLFRRADFPPKLKSLGNFQSVKLGEKSLTVNAEQAEEMIACARQNNRFLMEAMWTRFLPVIVKVREWLAEGAIGEPRMLAADKGSRQTLSTETLEGRLFNPELGGGGLLDVGVYSNGFENQVIEVINCLREGKLESDVMPLDESLSIMKTMDTIRFQWGLRYPEFRSVLLPPQEK